MTAAKKPRKKPAALGRKKPIKAKRMYACCHSDWTAHKARLFFSAEEKHTVYPVAVIDVSDEAALIEQVAQAITDDELLLDCGIHTSLHDARRVLESLGVIKRKARK